MSSRPTINTQLLSIDYTCCRQYELADPVFPGFIIQMLQGSTF